MKLNNILLMTVSSGLLLTACNSGGSSQAAPANGTYVLTNYDVTMTGNNCLNSQTCYANVSSNAIYNVTYDSNPTSYLLIPSPSSLPSGVTISTSGNCNTSPTSNYSCVITISSTGTSSGSNVNIPISGSLGQESFINLTYQ